MKVVLATGIEKLDHDLVDKMSDDTIAGNCYNRNVLLKVIETTDADTVVISPHLEGENDFVALVRSAREMGVRVVVLPGAPGQPQTIGLIKSLTPYGVYDYVFDPVRAEDVLGKINSPGNLGHVMRLIEGTIEPSESHDENEPGLLTDRPPRPRTGTPHVILAMGKELNRSFQSMFSKLIEIVAEVSTADEFKQAIMDYHPDIAVIMRNGPAGGIPDADVMAEWATGSVPEILFIAGELDETGSSMVARAQKAGVSHILSCPPGGYISGEELVYLMQNIVRKLQKTENRETTSEHRAKEKQSTVESLETLKRNATKLGNILRPKNKPAKKKAKSAGINMKEGVSLDEKPAEEQISGVKNPTAIVPGGLFAVVTPWRPGLAGRIAAQAVKMFAERGKVAYIAATGQSTGAVWLDVTDEELIMSDWRVPGSQAPVVPLQNPADQEFYESYTASRESAIQRLKRKFDNIDQRIRRMEHTVTSRDFDL